jgi:hypothetical protein
MADFSLIQTPNFAQAALGGYQAGRQIGQQKRMDAALQLYASDPDAGAHAVMQIDPEQGYKLQELARQKQIRELTAKAMSGGDPAAPAGAATPGAPPAQTGLQLNAEALHDLAKVDPQSAIAVQNFAKSANADQVKQVTEHLQQKGQWASYFSHFPEGPERTQAFHDALPQLQTMFSPQELASVDLSDHMLVRDQAMAASFSPPTELQRDAQYMDSRQPGLGLTYLTNKATPLVPVKGVDADGNETLTFMRPSAGGAGASAPTAPSKPNYGPASAPGLIAPGNIDLDHRAVTHNADGSYSTEQSFSIGTDKGEVLIPRVVGGKVLSQADAIAHYQQTGENLGTFASPAAADAYAEQLHKRQGAKYAPTYEGPDPMGFKGGVMTSGKRTPQGNASVGGVRNSSHLTGGGADFVPKAGEDLHDLLAAAQEYFGPTAKAFIDDANHVHVTLPGYTGIPYFGKNGAKGAPQVARPKNEAEYKALPSGAPYIAPDGSHRVKS